MSVVERFESEDIWHAAPWALHVRGENRLLRLLPDGERERLYRSMKRIKTDHGDVVFDRNVPIAMSTFRFTV